ncbi:MAG: monovalent cation/H(+) antiporter subunit G [Candidatus Thermoplasmatota archaeon]|nr:monovalent cation/H(+) antiporter subunit G [Candidatus Thermoplasmatota archaeon]MBS3790617.1 monovalent cation/H(+) antiporter subunit G [Candidatus Thermoplasmatota archaeon]
MFTATLGIIRFSDIYMRLHASGKASTGGTIAILAGVLIRIGLNQISGKVVLVMVFILFTGPIISHAIARAAHMSKETTAEIPFHDVEIEERGEKFDN